MGRYLARRLLQFIPVFFGATFLIFLLMFALPGDPVRALAGEGKPLSPSVVQELHQRYHLDDPLLVRYGYYIGGLLQGDFGQSLTGRDVSDIMAERWPVTIKLGLTAFVFEAVFGLALGVLAGLRRGGAMDNSVLITTLILISLPVFVIGSVGQLVFGVMLGWFPVAGIQDGWPYAYILPGLVLASLQLAYTARLTRTSLVENLRADYVRTALAKGLSRRRVIGVHALRNSLIPVVTLLGTDIGNLMAGAIVTEGIFNIPGIGQQIYKSVRLQESSVVVGIVTALVLIFMVANLLVDILYAVLDPRIRYD